MRAHSILHRTLVRGGAYFLICGAIAAAASGVGHAQEAAGSIRARLLSAPEVVRWLDRQMTTSERAALRDQDLKVTGAQCGCSDRPAPHYPYAVVIVSSPKGDLVARVEGDEGAIRMQPLALRTGTLYCSVDEGEGCFGEFAHPCEFTDARFGRALAPYFPDCKF
jgi:hypothetical protein